MDAGPAPRPDPGDFSALFETLPHAYLVLSPGLVIAAASDGFLEETFTRREALLGRPFFEAFPANPDAPPADAAKLRAAIETARETRRSHDLKMQRYDIRRPADAGGGFDERWWNIGTLPLIGVDGGVSWLVQNFEDVTDPVRKIAAAEARFRHAQDQFTATFEQNAVGIAHVALDGRLLQVNGHLAAMLCHSPQDMLALTIEAITWPEDRPTVRHEAAVLSAEELPLATTEERFLRADGTPLWVGTTRSLVRRRAGTPAYVVMVVEDISPRKAAELTLREREAHLKSILDTVPDGMVVIDDRGRIENFSRTAEMLFGYAAAEVIGRNVSLLMPSGDRERHDNYIQRYRDTGQARIIGVGRIVIGLRKDGSTFTLHLSVGEIASGHKRQFVGFVRDLTQHQEAETRLREMQAELVHMSRFTALGEMASALAHELNQPLTAIANYLKGCGRMLTQGIEGREAMLGKAVGQAADQALRAGQIIRRLRDFVARGESERHLEDLPKLIEEACVLAMLGARESGVRVGFSFDAAAQFVYADRIQIQQVIVNLGRNAIEAMQDSSRRDLLIATEARHDGMVEVRVRDSGPGLAPDIASHLFQPFFTTKATGMGVGLSICRTIVEAHEGKIEAFANPGGGTTFSFTLPSSKPEDGPAGGQHHAE